MDNILEVSGLRKNYGNFALKDVAFSLPEGCITGFIGVNGAGKTTTLRMLLRLTDKEAGKIQFLGLNMAQNERQIKDRLGIVLDDGCFYEELSLTEMKSIIAPAYTAWSERDFKQYMDMFSLDPKQKNQYVFQEHEDEICACPGALPRGRAADYGRAHQRP